MKGGKSVDLSSGPQDSIASQMFWNLGDVLRKLFFAILSFGPIPHHIAFILDGNRRYAKKMRLTEGGGHNAGFLAVIRMCKYCYEMGVKYVTIYAFSIDNYRRKPQEVQLLMNLMQIKMEELLEVEGLVHQFGVRVYFSGNLSLLSESVRKAADRVMAETSKNNRAVLSVCLAYTSTDEITHSIDRCIQDHTTTTTTNTKHLHQQEPEANANGGALKENGKATAVANGLGEEEEDRIGLVELERNMYMGIAPDPDILVRTSGETRLSNFLLWQTAGCLLYSPAALWPEIGLRELVWGVLNFQRGYPYLEKKRKQL